MKNQKKLDVNVSFENELAEYLVEMAEMENKTIQEVLANFVREEFEAEKEMVEIIKEHDAESLKQKQSNLCSSLLHN
jgi:hypothetical protein